MRVFETNEFITLVLLRRYKICALDSFSTVGVVAERLAAALCVANTITTYGANICMDDVSCLTVCGCEFKCL